MKNIIKTTIQARSKMSPGASQYAFSMAPVNDIYMYTKSISTNFFTKSMIRAQDTGELMGSSCCWFIGSKSSSKNTWDFILNH